MKDKVLDLHGIRHVDVSRMIDSFMGEHVLMGSREVLIITGNSVRMKQIVGETLSDYQITPKEDILNQGTLIVDLT